MTSYALTPLAQDDLLKIYRYTAKMWEREQARRYLDALERTFDHMSEHPGTGRSYERICPGYWGWDSGSHIVFATCDDGVWVIRRILHQRQDVKRNL